MVLLVVDTQKLITNEGLYEFDMFVSNVKEIILEARANNAFSNRGGSNPYFKIGRYPELTWYAIRFDRNGRPQDTAPALLLALFSCI